MIELASLLNSASLLARVHDPNHCAIISAVESQVEYYGSQSMIAPILCSKYYQILFTNGLASSSHYQNPFVFTDLIPQLATIIPLPYIWN